MRAIDDSETVRPLLKITPIFTYSEASEIMIRRPAVGEWVNVLRELGGRSTTNHAVTKKFGKIYNLAI